MTAVKFIDVIFGLGLHYNDSLEYEVQAKGLEIDDEKDNDSHDCPRLPGVSGGQ